MAGCDPKTFRKWIWEFLTHIANFNMVRFYICLILICTDNFQIRVSVDGLDFQIYEPSPFNSCWYSFKHNGPGLRYEISLSIRTGKITSVDGPFPCGSFLDLKIFRGGIKNYLEESEMVIADKGYPDEKVYHDIESERFVRSRHEHIHKRSRHFGVLRYKFVHDIRKHSVCFRAVANLTQLAIVSGEPLYNIEEAFLESELVSNY